jgi:hypothetical protein
LVVPELAEPVIEIAPAAVAVIFCAPLVPSTETPVEAVDAFEVAEVTNPEISIAGDAVEPVLIVDV